MCPACCGYAPNTGRPWSPAGCQGCSYSAGAAGKGAGVSPGSRGAPPGERGTARGCSVDSSGAFGKHQAGTHLSSPIHSPLCSRRGGARRGWRPPARSRGHGGDLPRSPSATQEDPDGGRSLFFPAKNPDKRTTQVPPRPPLGCCIPVIPVQTAAHSHPAQPRQGPTGAGDSGSAAPHTCPGAGTSCYGIKPRFPWIISLYGWGNLPRPGPRSATRAPATETGECRCPKPRQPQLFAAAGGRERRRDGGTAGE